MSDSDYKPTLFGMGATIAIVAVWAAATAVTIASLWKLEGEYPVWVSVIAFIGATSATKVIVTGKGAA